ncbi:maleylpyruvate isomerase N-terminal domain-containing protein [bacterium]|nr:maleylpyruvate isomerase N-terminal domain-containing protein [bacterium]
MAEERHRFADFLEGLTGEQWDTSSSCGEWTVKGVAAHMLVGPVMGLRGAMSPFMGKT